MPNRRRSLLPALLLSLLSLLAAGCAATGARSAPAAPAAPAAPPALALGGVAFHSLQWQVKLAALPPGLEAAMLHAQLQQALDAVEDVLTTYGPSELMRLNAWPVGEWMPASPALLRALAVAGEAHRLSGGAYDPTVGPLVELWGFGASPAPAAVPSAEAIAAARARVGWQGVEVDAARGRARRRADVRLDLSSLGEGAGVEALLAVLDRAGVHDALVRVAGTARARGHRPDGGPWTLAVETPDGSGLAGRTLVVADAVVSTSGSYRNVREIGGRRFSHTLDPATGWPVTHAGVSVTLLLPAEQGADRADALATALNVLGPDRGLALAERQGWAVLYVEHGATGFRERWSPAFAAWRAP